eukprot:CAMPEP_0118894086 /NCGR_PEP_ID=MMETSP1166-20130328/3018_1 /TAXON_ID=1104430 /ORGANISM="Chrysoreinhardia sp, Strain CCMP3193" /LENGTH=629 /DNA_ID=CAMNT_0006832967 /DNA_START=200 /DNA_END=2089 /DNA_ORIENTATION=+
MLRDTGESNALKASSYFAALTFARIPAQFLAMVEQGLRTAWTTTGDDVFDDPTSSLRLCRASIRRFWSQIHELRWFRVFEQILLSVIRNGASVLATRMTRGCYDRPLRCEWILWKESALRKWLDDVQGNCVPHVHVASSAALSFFADIVVDNVFIEIRMSELYDMLAEFPDSICAAFDLRECLLHMRQYHYFAACFCTVLRGRLLHAGANTSQIIDMYISADKFLRILGFRGHLLASATDQIQNYLRLRVDTVRCIVSALTADTQEPVGRATEQRHADLSSEGFEISSLFPTRHDHAEADVEVTSSRHPLPALMAIYGSSDIFVSEFKRMLAEKLLNMTTSVDREVKNLELLKLKFGDTPLCDCEVMLRDVQESQRLNGFNQYQVVTAHIVSHVFWPPMEHTKVYLHWRLCRLLRDYAKVYHHMKAPRQLDWKRWLGHITLQLTHGRYGQTVQVSPEHATLLLHLEEHSALTAAELSRKCCIAECVVRKRMMRWLNQGIVIVMSDGAYSSSSPAAATAAPKDAHLTHDARISPRDDDAGDHEDDNSDFRPSAVCINSDEHAKFASYVTGMLTNLGCLSLERIYGILQMFLSHDDLNEVLTLGKVADILRQLCDAEEVECKEGLYQLTVK